MTPIRASGCAALLFETWLQTELQHLYDRALDEPVPDELLRLIPQGSAADRATGPEPR